MATQNATNGFSLRALVSRKARGALGLNFSPLCHNTSGTPTRKVKSAMKPRMRVDHPKPTNGSSLCRAMGYTTPPVDVHHDSANAYIYIYIYDRTRLHSPMAAPLVTVANASARCSTKEIDTIARDGTYTIPLPMPTHTPCASTICLLH